MKHNRWIWTVLACLALACGTASCVNQNYIMLEDDEWSGARMDADRDLINGELERDDWDR